MRSAVGARAVETRLDGEHVAGDERRVAEDAEDRLLVHLEPDAVAERVEEALLERLALDLRALRREARPPRPGRRPRRRRTCAGRRPAGSRRARRSSHSRQRRCHSAISAGDVADDERASHVGEARRLGVARPEVDDDRLAGAQLPLAEVMADRRLRPVRDDEDVGGGAVLEERRRDRRLEPSLVSGRPSSSSSAVADRQPPGRSRSRAAAIPASAAACARRIPASSARDFDRRRSAKVARGPGRSSTPAARSRSAVSDAGTSPARPPAPPRAPAPHGRRSRRAARPTTTSSAAARRGRTPRAGGSTYSPTFSMIGSSIAGATTCRTPSRST